MEVQKQNNQKLFWQFSAIPNLEEANFDKMLERFYSMKINGLVRENIQNSLDGKKQGVKGPVIVKIKTGNIKVSEIPGIAEIKNRIQCLVGKNSYTKETIEHMQKQIDQDEVRFISFEDINTRGLSGAKNGQSNSLKDTWSAYAYNKGVHSEEEESEEKSRGGSHGVGKIASNSASDIHISYFANCDGEGDQHLGGTIQLIEHVYKNQCYRSTGYFAKCKNITENKTKYYPFENNFSDVFKKDTQGLKIIIPFLRKEFDNDIEIIKSVIESFFVGILKENLVVYVNDKEISAATLTRFINDQKYYVQDVKEAKKEFTPLYIHTYANIEPQQITVSNGETDYHFDLYFRYDNEIPKGRVAIVRTVGMKIEDFKVKNHASKPFNAVLIGGADEDSYLKSLENESHTALSFEHIKNNNLEKKAKKFINNLSKVIGEIIKKIYEENNPTDGIMNTNDILYTVENKFKKILSKTTGTVLVNKGNPLVKTSTGVEKNIRHRNTSNTKKLDKDKPRKTRKPRKIVQPDQKQDAGITSDNNTKPNKYSIYPESVERLIIGDEEFVKLDFQTDKEISRANKCNIEISVVDGMGNEYPNEFDIQKNYMKITDKTTYSNCLIEENKIKNVSIKNGVVNIQLSLNKQYNRALKFIYYVEV